jgi:hypothetical protein
MQDELARVRIAAAAEAGQRRAAQRARRLTGWQPRVAWRDDIETDVAPIITLEHGWACRGCGLVNHDGQCISANNLPRGQR